MAKRIDGMIELSYQEIEVLWEKIHGSPPDTIDYHDAMRTLIAEWGADRIMEELRNEGLPVRNSMGD